MWQFHFVSSAARRTARAAASPYWPVSSRQSAAGADASTASRSTPSSSSRCSAFPSRRKLRSTPLTKPAALPLPSFLTSATLSFTAARSGTEPRYSSWYSPISSAVSTSGSSFSGGFLE